VRPRLIALAIASLLFAPAGAGGLGLFSGRAAPTRQAGGGQEPDSTFRQLAGQLAQERLDGIEGGEARQEQALGILDRMVLETLNAGGEPKLDSLNQRLAKLITQQPLVGEGYRVVRLNGSPAVYALVVNFGLAGPSAVRIYGSTAGGYALAARIDRFAQKGFFDEYLELVPISAPATLFVVVTGRTDDLQTGAFTVWRMDGERLWALWSSEILQQSSYESGADGFRLTYCAQTDEDHPRVCRRMTRDRYVWDGAAWKRVEQTPLPVPKR